ncbi:hypothetical protein BDV59DRAFT_185041 [Aspergillus ambiguus]|uniref:uncharacterized protein n=1 Tax=Aspergillus ambiguus TaxID=176160 RepID=UPI003CCE4362
MTYRVRSTAVTKSPKLSTPCLSLWYLRDREIRGSFPWLAVCASPLVKLHHNKHGASSSPATPCRNRSVVEVSTGSSPLPSGGCRYSYCFLGQFPHEDQECHHDIAHYTCLIVDRVDNNNTRRDRMNMASVVGVEHYAVEAYENRTSLRGPKR